jgi:hypothetical protein
MPDINNTITPNRGVELILTGGNKKKRKLFHIIYEKMMCFLNREVTIYFEFSIRSRKVN